MSSKKDITYREAGVDISAGNQVVEMIKLMVKNTWRSEVLTDIGGFGGFFALDSKKYEEPVLVSGTDGVGTKLKIAQILNRHDSIGIDAVAMCVNDIVVCGAEPLFFLDYLAVGKMDQEKVTAIVSGIVEGCRQAGCALIGGETAEMPGFYGKDEYDIAGFAVGVVERSKIINGANIKPGDCVIGLASSGLHSNGYSLARKVLLERAGLGLYDYVPELQKELGEEMLIPTRIYARVVREILDRFPVQGMAHITGGGLVENIPRILPPGLCARLRLGNWPQPEIFSLIQKLGPVKETEMYRTFNMGLGLVLVISSDMVHQVLNYLKKINEDAYLIGEIISGESRVDLISD